LVINSLVKFTHCVKLALGYKKLKTIMALAVNDSNFNQIVINSDKPVLVDFWATWCGPCRMVSPIVDDLATEYEGKAVITKCDVDSSSEVPLKYGIRNIPTILFFKNGELKDKIVGATTKSAIVAKINALM